MGLCASVVYLMNDLLDLESDRAHDTKKNRPFASGNLPLHVGIILMPLLFNLIRSGIFSSQPYIHPYARWVLCGHLRLFV